MVGQNSRSSYSFIRVHLAMTAAEGARQPGTGNMGSFAGLAAGYLKRAIRRLLPAPTNPHGFGRAVFVGCARNSAHFVPSVLQNLERLAATYREAAFIFIGNDSVDSTDDLLRDWAGQRNCAQFVSLPGLAARFPLRTARLAYARNEYLRRALSRRFNNFDHLVIIDFDDVASGVIDIPAFVRAKLELDSTHKTAAVFANSMPVYYDIWALRHEKWSPDDCWRHTKSLESPSAGSQIDAVERVRARQIFISPDAASIQVTSAFGGLGIYKLALVRNASYHGLNDDGTERCEHVPFNEAVATKGALYVLPYLLLQAPREHLGEKDMPFATAKAVRLSDGDNHLYMLAPADHPIELFRTQHPLYDRRLPLLSSLVSEAKPGSVMIDVGANIGDTAALCRLAGCKLEIIAVEPSDTYLGYLNLNRVNSPDLFKNVHPVRAFIGPPGAKLQLVEQNGTGSVRYEAVISTELIVEDIPPTIGFSQLSGRSVSLVKTDTDGFDAEILLSNIHWLREMRPIIWSEADVSPAANSSVWRTVLEELQESHRWACIFDNFGFLVAHGDLANKLGLITDLIEYGRQHKAFDSAIVGVPRIYYLDIAFFPVGEVDLYRRFVRELVEHST